MNLINGSQPCVFRENILDDVRCFLNRARQQILIRATPVTTLTYAQSLDGCIALSEGRTLQLSNEQTQRLTHQIRSMHDAILVGINTVLSDDPQLTVRLSRGPNPQPVVVDSGLRFPMDARLLQDPCVRPIIATSHQACPRRTAELRAAGAEILHVPVTEDGRVDLRQLMVVLKQRGLQSLMIEGGATIITSVLAAGLADQLLVTIAPRFVGGLRSVKLVSDDEREGMPRLRNLQFSSLAGDVVIRGDLVHDGLESGQELDL